MQAYVNTEYEKTGSRTNRKQKRIFIADVLTPKNIGANVEDDIHDTSANSGKIPNAEGATMEDKQVLPKVHNEIFYDIDSVEKNKNRSEL